MGDVILRALNIHKAFIGVQALRDVSVDIRSGEILCLVGENGSGKSTFVKTVSGIYQPDGGEILINGQSFRHLSPQQAIRLGIQVIYQDLSLFGHMTVAENIAINRIRQEGRKVIDWKEVYRIAGEQTRRIGVSLDLNATVMETSMANRQLTAICRALAQDARILFMDEPTTALTRQEVTQLLKVVGELKAAGLAIVFISHKLDEVFQVADKITIFRDGRKIGDFPSAELDPKKLAFYMTGREVEYPRYVRRERGDSPLLEVRGLTKTGNYEEISFTVRRGDIFGLTGLLGSGRTELALSLFGLNPPDSGEVLFEGRSVDLRSPSAAKRAGIALLPEDRSTQGMFRDRCVRENLSSAMVEEISNGMGVIDRARERRLSEDSVKRLRVRTPSVETPIGSLSGGNQQKAIVAKWISRSPRLFIMDTPTVGVDIGSKAEIYELIQGFAGEGMAILMITDEMEELLANCNRVMIMAAHRQIALLDEEALARPDAANMIQGLISSSAEERRRAL
jgi:simple sugar transport system ATP-binding protein